MNSEQKLLIVIAGLARIQEIAHETWIPGQFGRLTAGKPGMTKEKMEAKIENRSDRVKKLEVRIETIIANDWRELRECIRRRAQAITLVKEIV